MFIPFGQYVDFGHSRLSVVTNTSLYYSSTEKMHNAIYCLVKLGLTMHVKRENKQGIDSLKKEHIILKQI
jgi:hypothetical protein